MRKNLNRLMLLAVLLLVLNPLAVAQPLVQVRHKAYNVYYDLTTHNAALVIWSLQFSDFSGANRLKSGHFKIDPNLPPPRVKSKHFAGTGFVRGHLCPVGDFDSRKDLMKDTYYCSNVSPMFMATNSGPWRVVEDSCRILAAKGHLLIIGVIPLVNSDKQNSFCNTNSSNSNSPSGDWIYPDERKPNFGIAIPYGFLRIARCTVHAAEVYAWFVWNSPRLCAPVRLNRISSLKSYILDERIWGLVCSEVFQDVDVR